MSTDLLGKFHKIHPNLLRQKLSNLHLISTVQEPKFEITQFALETKSCLHCDRSVNQFMGLILVNF